MLVHHRIAVHAKAGLRREYLCNDILEEVSNGEGDRPIRLRNSGLHTDFIEVEISCSFVRGHVKGGGDITAANSLLPPC